MQKTVSISADTSQITYTEGGKFNGTVEVDPTSSESGFSVVLYDNTNGLPTSEANDIVQTKDGFIWIGSYSGLTRYDGNHFDRWEDGGSIAGIKCLYVDSKDRLWVGTNDEGVLMIERGEVRHFNLDNGMKSITIRSICEDGQGRIYVATAYGLAIIDEDLELSYPEDPRASEDFFQEVRKGVDGTIYCLNNSGDVLTLKNGKVDHLYPLSKTEIGGVNCMLPDPADPDLIYLETISGKVFHGALNDDYSGAETIDISPLFQLDSFQNLDGDIWLCARNGVGVIKEDGFHVLEDLPMNSSIGHAMSDYEGNLWFTSTRQGVLKIVKNRFTDVFARSELSRRVVNSTCMYDGLLYIGTDTGLLALDDYEPVLKIPLNEEVSLLNSEEKTDDLLTLLDDCRIRSLICDSKQRLWISTWRSYGLLRYDHGDLKFFNKENGMTFDSIRTVFECADGRILSAGNGGVNIIKDDEVIATYGEKEGISNVDVLSVTEGKNGDILVGSDGGGIFIISRNGVRQLGYEDGLTSSSVMRIKKDSTENVYWIITGNKLEYMNDDYEITSVDLFPYANNFDIYENSKQEMWVLSSNGIYVARKDEILSGDSISTVHYTLSDGLPCIATANSYSELTDEGDLYIAGSTGVAKVNIEDDYEDANELKFSIPYVMADEELIYPDKEGRFIIPINTRKLMIYGYIFNYSLAEPIVQYRLEGFDSQNYTITPSNTFPVYYTNLPGGNYNFIIDLKYWNDDQSMTVSVEIIKEKAFYEKPLFYVMSTVSVLAILLGLIALYENKREEKLERIHKEETEKQRISSELTMGYNIQLGMLPHDFPPFPDRDEFDLYASIDPAREVGGDFYDFFLIDDDHLCLTMADVSGKGIPGALFMMLSKTIVHNTAFFAKSPAEILEMSNNAICENNAEQMFVTVWLGILELSTGKLVAANAGHEYPVFKMPDGKYEIYKDIHGFVLGGMEDLKYKDYEVDLQPGSRIFLYTDGVPEATDVNDRMYGLERLETALNKEPDADPKKLLENVADSIDDFVGDAEQFDDLTMMSFVYKGTQKK